MDDLLLVVCGGGAYNVVKESMDLLRSELLVLTKEESAVPLDDLPSIKERMDGKRIIIPFCTLGGEIGTELVSDVIRCARECGCKVVSILGMPMEIEADRREKASKSLPELVSMSDVSMVYDMTRTMDVYDDLRNRKLFDFMKMTNRIIMNSIGSIMEVMDGPFFTVFPERMYAFSSTNDVLPENAIDKAWGTMLFDNETEKGSCIIMVGAGTASAEIDGIRDHFVREYGIMPEVLRRSDTEDSKVIVFKAVNSLIIPSYPSAKASRT